MSDIKIFSKSTPASGAIDISAPVVMSERALGGKLTTMSETARYDRAFGSSRPKKLYARTAFDLDKVKAFGGFMHTPVAWADGLVESAYERVTSGRFGKGTPKGSTGNTLMPDWATLWDAMRLDITTQKNALPTIRENIYNIASRPNASKLVKSTEFYPYGVVFEDYTNSGQAVAQGDKREGQVYNIEITLKAAGFMWDLLAEMFDESLDPAELSLAVARGYNARVDNDAIAPILNADYGTVDTNMADGYKHWTKADATSGLDRQELLYRTIANAFDALSLRPNPIIKRKIDVNGAMILASGYDARHIAQVTSGLPSTNQKYLPALPGLGGVIIYDGDTVDLRDKSVTYAGVTNGYAYLLVPKNRYANIITKQGLTAEVDLAPDVKTLAREEYAWYYADGVDSKFVDYFVQKITLPAW